MISFTINDSTPKRVEFTDKSGYKWVAMVRPITYAELCAVCVENDLPNLAPTAYSRAKSIVAEMQCTGFVSATGPNGEEIGFQLKSVGDEQLPVTDERVRKALLSRRHDLITWIYDEAERLGAVIEAELGN